MKMPDFSEVFLLPLSDQKYELRIHRFSELRMTISDNIFIVSYTQEIGESLFQRT